MNIQCALYPFVEFIIDSSVDEPGVYELIDGEETIYFGKSDTSIRDRLEVHKAGRGKDKCTQSASHYKYEVCSNPIARERQLLKEYHRAHGKLPRCNDVMP